VSTKKLRLSPPADTILDSLETLGWTRADLAERMGLEASEIEALVMNRTRITADIAEAFSRTIGGSTRFWLNRDANYQAALAERRGHDRSEDRP
jgi:HTH-type transcriptional regulator / antitoxin HigA